MFKTLVTIFIFALIPNIYLFNNQMGIGYTQFILLCYTLLGIIAWVGYKTAEQNKDLQINLPVSSLTFSLILFLIINLVSTFFSKSVYASLFGGYGHSADGIFLLIELIMFFIFFWHIANKGILIKAVWLSILGITIALIWGFFNPHDAAKYGILPIHVHSTQESGIFFANYLLFGLPISLSLIVASGRIITRLGGIISAGLIILGIFLSITRSVWITILITCVISPLIFLSQIKLLAKSILNKKLLLLLGLVVIVMIFYLFPIIQGRINRTLKDGFNDDSIRIRLLEYKSALSIIKDYPLLGTGPDTIAYIYPQYRSIILNNDDREWYRQTPDIRSYFLQIAATIGIPGLIVFIGIILSVILIYVKYIRLQNQDKKILVSGIFFGWLVLVIHYIFYSSTITTQILMWSSMGLLAGIIIKGEIRQRQILLFTISRKVLWWLLVPGFLLWIGVVYLVSTDLISNYFFAQRNNIEDIRKKAAITKQTIALNPTSATFLIGLVALNNNIIAHMNQDGQVPQTEAEQLFRENEQSLRDAQRLDPLNPKLAYYRAWFMYEKFRALKYLGKDRIQVFNQAEESAKFAISLDPTDPIPWDMLTVIYLDMDGKKLKEAETSARKSLSLKNNYAFGFHHLVESLKQQGRFDEAIAVCQENMKIIPDDNFPIREIDRIKQLQIRVNGQK